MTKPASDMSIKELEALSLSLQADLERLNKERRRKADAKTEVDKILCEKRKPPVEPKISDHALLRYLERAMGVDVIGLRTKLMTPTIVSAIKAGASSVTCGGLKFQIRDNTITTVID